MKNVPSKINIIRRMMKGKKAANYISQHFIITRQTELKYVATI